MKKVLLTGAAVVSAMGISSAAYAADVLTFEGLQDEEQIANFYDGGYGGSGSGPGPNYGITFGADSLALISTAAGGSGAFTNAPSGVTVAFFLSGAGDILDKSSGFSSGFSFYYADQVGFTGNVTVWSGLDGTGTELASISLSPTPDPYNVWAAAGVTFTGVAQSAVFGGSANYIGFDNITIGSATPGGGVPEPSTWALMGLGFAGLAFAGYRSRRSAAAIA